MTCWAQNSAVDIYGHPAVSALQSWHIAIRVPTVATAWFTKLVDKLKCGWVTERVRVPGHWVKVRRHGKLVRVYRRAHWVKKRVLSCHPRFVRRRVRVHGRWRVVRVPVFPHLIQQTVRRIGFGKRATVAGWLGATSGQPLGGQLVRVLTSPYPGPVHFTQAAVVRTGSHGTWSTQLRAGPGRLVEAFYAGSPLTEPSVSPDARLVVPAKITIHVAPTHVQVGRQAGCDHRPAVGRLDPDQQARGLPAARAAHRRRPCRHGSDRDPRPAARRPLPRHLSLLLGTRGHPLVVLGLQPERDQLPLRRQSIRLQQAGHSRPGPRSQHACR